MILPHADDFITHSAACCKPSAPALGPLLGRSRFSSAASCKGWHAIPMPCYSVIMPPDLCPTTSQPFGRVGMEQPKVEVRFENVSVEAMVNVGSRGMPTVFNAYRNVVEGALTAMRVLRTERRPFTILQVADGACIIQLHETMLELVVRLPTTGTVCARQSRHPAETRASPSLPTHVCVFAVLVASIVDTCAIALDQSSPRMPHAVLVALRWAQPLLAGRGNCDMPLLTVACHCRCEGSCF